MQDRDVLRVFVLQNKSPRGSDTVERRPTAGRKALVQQHRAESKAVRRLPVGMLACCECRILRSKVDPLAS